MRRLFLLFFIIVFSMIVYADEKIIDVPNQLVVEMVLANDEGLINGQYDVRARIFNVVTLERLWFEDFEMQDIENGSFVLILNTDSFLNSYELHQENLNFVVTVGEESVEVPLLTDFYSYRSLNSEYAWQTRFPEIFYVDRSNGFVGIGNEEPATYLDVNGAIKLSYEDTDVTGSIRLAYDSLRVKHPERWVDLLYGPLTFISSRWVDYSTNIQLVSSNYNIGINMDYPSHKLHVEGDLYVDGEIRAGSLLADSFLVNSAALSSTDFVAQQLFVFDDDTTLLWNQNNLNVLELPIYGDGIHLTNVGQLEKDFQVNLISSEHLDGEVISSRNVAPFSIYTHHFYQETLNPDQFSRDIFNADTISENAIVSDNIIEESLYFSIFENTNLYDYVPDQFFESNVIATDNVLSYNIQDYSIASFNFSDNSIASFNIKDDIVLGSHIADDQVLPSKIKDGEITSDLFSGVLGFSNGGTGLASVDSYQILRVAETSYDSNTVMYIDDAMNIGLYDTNSLLSVDRNFNHIFEVGSLTSNATIKITETGSNNINLSFENVSNQVFLTLLNSGELTFNNVNSSFYLFPSTAVSSQASSSQLQLDIGSAVTVGDSVNSAPQGGTIEYNGIAFRFFNGVDWTLVSDLGYGIGQPVATGHYSIEQDNSFLGSISSSQLNVDSSMVYALDRSSLDATHSVLHSVELSSVHLDSSNVGRVFNSDVSGKTSQLDFISGSNLQADSSRLDYIVDSNVYSIKGKALGVFDSNVTLGNSIIYNGSALSGIIEKSSLVLVDNAIINGHSMALLNSDELNVSGRSHYLNDVFMATVSGQYNNLNHADRLTINGANNNVFGSEDVAINGSDNHLFNAKHVSVLGAGQRMFSDDSHVVGSDNVVFGNKVTINGNNNIVFNASDEPISVDANNKLVMNSPNGVHIFTGDGMVVSATEYSGGWTMVSDKNLKKSFLQVDHQETFNKLMDLDVSKWEYVFNKGVYHIGPMAQQFKSVFNIGEDERFITASDADGIAFSALKFLVQETDDLQKLSNANGNVDLENVESLIKKLNVQLDSFNTSLQMKDAAFKTLVDNNLKQYQLIDRQLKVVSRYLKRIDKKGFLLDVLQLLGAILLGIGVGFYGVKLYHKTRR